MNKPNRKDLRVISLDLWKTLIVPNPEFRQHRTAAIAAALQQTPSNDFQELIKSVDDFLDQTTDKNGQQFGCVARTEMLAERVKFTQNIDYEFLYNEINYYFVKYPPLLIEPALPEILRFWRAQGKQIVLLSNTGFVEGKSIRSVFNAMNISDLFHHLFFSDEHDMAKPQAAFFEKITQHCNCAAHEILHIGDNPLADYAGAKNAGMNALVFSPETPHATLPSVSSIADLHAYLL